MAPHLTSDELDFIFQKEEEGVPVKKVHALLQKRRSKRGIVAPCLMRFRLVLRGKSYRRSQQETRGRRRKFTRLMVLKMNKQRKTAKQLAEEANQ